MGKTQRYIKDISNPRTRRAIHNIFSHGITPSGDARLDFSDCTVGAINTDGGIVKAGTSSDPITQDTADMKFMAFYFDNGATSGDNRGMYLRQYLTGAGGGGEALRVFTTCSDVACGTAHGSHISLNFGTSGSVTGQGIAMRATLHMPSTALGASNVTYAAVQTEIYSDGATSDPSGNLLSAIRVINAGNATGMADVDDDCAMLQLNGWTDATGNMVYGSTIRIRLTTTDKYLVMSTAEDSLTMPAPLTIGVDGTGHDVTFYGDTASAKLLWDQSDDALEINGDARLDFSANTVKAANTDGGIIKAGTSSAKVTEDTADMKFVSMYFDNGATSGDNRGMYLRLYLTGAGGGGEALRVFTTCENVACGTAHGAHISLNFGATGTVTGQGIAMRATLHIPDVALTSNVTMSAVQAEIYSDGSTSDPGGSTLLSCFRAINAGDATGMADVDDDAVLFELSGWTSGSAKLWYDHQGGAPANVEEWIKIRTPAGVRWLAAYDAVV